MRLLSSGILLCLALVSLASCRKDKPPVITICIGDGYGGAECLLRDGTREYWPPSKLENAWITTQEDMERFAGWCYDTSQKNATGAMSSIRDSIEGAE